MDFRPEGLQFPQPAAISLGYTIEESSSKKLFIFTFENITRQWKVNADMQSKASNTCFQRLQEYESVVDTVNKVVRSKILHFSFYSVMLQEVAVLPPFNSTVGNQTLLVKQESKTDLTVVYACVGAALGVLMAVGAICQVSLERLTCEL